MRNIGLLLKNYLLSGLGNLRRKNAKTKAIVGIISIAVLYAVLFAVILWCMLFLAKDSEPLGLVPTVLAMGLIISVFMALIFSLQKITGGQKANDTELLLSMPIKKFEIITAKTLASFGFNLAFVALFYLPSVIAYLVYTPFNLVAIIGCFLVMFLIPLMAVGLSGVIDFFVTVCFSSSKIGNIAKAFFAIFTLVAVIVVYEFFSFNLENPIVMNNIVNWIITFNPIVMIPVICGSVLLFILGCWLNSLLLNRENRGTQYKSISISRKVTTPLKSLLKNETNRYFNSPTLMINTLIGPLAIVFLTVWLCIDKGKTILDFILLLGISENALYLLIGIVFASSAVLTYPAGVSISLEGKQLWILRSMPISAVTVISAKALFNILLLVPVTLLAGIVLMIVLKISLWNFVVMMIIPILTAILISYLGVLINLWIPKFDYENENLLIKQSTSSTILLFFGFFYILALSGITIWLMFQISLNILAGIIIAILAIMATIAVVLCYTVGQRIFNRL